MTEEDSTDDPTVTDDQRDETEAALLAALLLIYVGTRRQILDRLGLFGQMVLPSAGAAALAAFAADRAAKIQSGINTRIASTLAALPPNATADDRAAALGQLQTSITAYNADVLLPFLAAWATHQALSDTYDDLPAPDATDAAAGMTRKDAVTWTWDQLTDFPDDCMAAADASPASYDDLIGIAGGPPPVHERCRCSLTPND